MNKMRVLCGKLQMALSAQGINVSTRQSKFYSEKVGGIVTKYECYLKNKKIYETWKLHELVKFMASMLKSEDDA